MLVWALDSTVLMGLELLFCVMMGGFSIPLHIRMLLDRPQKTYVSKAKQDMSLSTIGVEER